MFGTGLPEFIIIVLVIVVLFGPAVLTFWLGYTMGRNQPAGTGSDTSDREDDASDAGSEEKSDE